jgi:PPOX class probable F420-dependent enzyme
MYRRDGTAVGTPVNVMVDGDRAFFRTYAQTWKYRRLQHRVEADLAPSTWRGCPTGPSVHASARILEGTEAERAGRLIDRKDPLFQWLLVRLLHKVLGYRTVHTELTPAASEAPGAVAGS